MGRDTPRYLIEAKGSFFWQPSSELRAAGWSPLRLGKERSAAIAQAVERNAEVDAWRAAGKPARSADAAVGAAAGGRTWPAGSCSALFALYRRDAKYPTNAHTKRQYDSALDYLEKWLGPIPARAVTPRMAEKRYLELAKRTPAQAAAIMRVARRAFGRSRFLADPHSPLHVKVNDNPFVALDLKGSIGEGRLWTRKERDALVKAALGNQAHYPSIAVAVELNWWLAQREGDILALGRDALDGDTLTIEQHKTRRRVHLPIPLVPKIRALFARALELQAALGVASLSHLLVNEDTGKPWDEHAFRKAFRKVRAAAELGDDLQFMYLRHTGVVEMEDAGCTVPEIAAVSGHSLNTVHTILERYGRRTRTQAENAIRKRLEREQADGSQGGSSNGA